MPALSWVRFARRVTGLVRQRELPNLESLIDAESERQPFHNLFILSCAIPAGIATFGFGSVFVAWLAGNGGLPLLLGSALTVALSAAAWFIFYRLYKSIPPSRMRLRKLIMKLTPRYGSFGNIIGGVQVLSDDFGALLDEASGIYLRHCSNDSAQQDDAPDKAVRAIEEAMARLMEVAVSKDRHAQDQALVWAEPILAELRLLDASLKAHAITAKMSEADDPLAGLRDARVELEATTTAMNELSDHVTRN